MTLEKLVEKVFHAGAKPSEVEVVINGDERGHFDISVVDCDGVVIVIEEGEHLGY